jgi:hypothetical protein
MTKKIWTTWEEWHAWTQENGRVLDDPTLTGVRGAVDIKENNY